MYTLFTARPPLGPLTLIAFLVLVACGPAATPTGGSAPPAPASPAQPAAAQPSSAQASSAQASAAQPSAPAPSASQQWDQLLAEGRREGTVIVAGPPLPTLREAYSEMFPRDTGIQLQYLSVPAAEISARAEREALAGRPSMDVLVGGGSELYTLLPKGLLEPLAPVLVLPEVTDPTAWRGDKGVKWMDKEGQYLAVGTSWVMTDLFVNTRDVPSGSLKSWRDLLDPRWKGKIIAGDPRVPGPGQSVARYLLHKFGEQYVIDLYQGQEAVLVRDQRQIAEGVATGRYPIGIGAIQSDIEEFRKAGLPIAREFPADGPGSLVGGYSGFKLMKNGPHPKAGIVFINWALSKNGLTAFQNALMETSLRKDIPTDGLPPYVIPDPNVVYDIDQYDYDFYMNITPRLSERLRELLGR